MLEFIDICPTLLDLAGLEIPRRLDRPVQEPLRRSRELPDGLDVPVQRRGARRDVRLDEYKFDCRNQVQVSVIYPEGFLFTYATNFGNGSGSRSMIYGTEGVMDFTRRPVISGSGSFGKNNIKEETSVEPVDCPDHFLNWLECLRRRKQPVAPIEAGYQHSVACIMADRAMQTGERQVDRPQSDEICAG